MSEVYAAIRWVVHLAGRRTAAWIGSLLLFAYQGWTTGQPTAAIPDVFLWVLFVGACMLLRRLLPEPGKGGLATEKPFPVSRQAVSLTPSHDAKACPGVAEMTDRLSPRLKALLSDPSDSTTSDGHR